MRKSSLPIAGAIVNVALSISLAKGWADRIPNSLVFGLYLLSLLPIIWWGITHEKLLRHREKIKEAYRQKPKTVVGLGLLLSVPVCLSLAVGIAFIYRKVTPLISHPPSSPQNNKPAIQPAPPGPVAQPQPHIVATLNL